MLMRRCESNFGKHNTNKRETAMGKRDVITERIIREDERTDGGLSYLYRLAVCENDRHASFRIPLYSVYVNMTDADGEETSASIKNAFCDAGQALIFYDKVVKNLATPIDLTYIFEDEMH